MPWRPLEITRQQRGFRWVLPRGFYISRSAAVGGAPAAFTFEPAGAINKHVRVIGVAGAGISQRDEEHHCDEHNRQYLLLSYRLTAQSARGKLQLLGCHACSLACDVCSRSEREEKKLSPCDILDVSEMKIHAQIMNARGMTVIFIFIECAGGSPKCSRSYKNIG
jgi:hypothetical protein